MKQIGLILVMVFLIAVGVTSCGDSKPTGTSGNFTLKGAGS